LACGGLGIVSCSGALARLSHAESLVDRTGFLRSNTETSLSLSNQLGGRSCIREGWQIEGPNGRLLALTVRGATTMTVTKETIALEGVLRGEGRERACVVKALQHATYSDECTRPTCLSYSRCVIEDDDDFPDGEYELEFAKRRVPLSKTGGQYVPRLTEAPCPCTLSVAS